MRVVVTCGDAARLRWAPTGATDGARELPDRPGREELDPLLDGLPVGGRLVVAGDDAALAAVLTRLLRRERLDVEVAVLPASGSVAATAWELPTAPDDALALAVAGVARPVPLVRDDRGGVVAGRHRVADCYGEVYADEHRLRTGHLAALEITPDPRGRGTRARVTGPRRLGGLRGGEVVEATGRAVQLGCRPATVVRDGVPDDRTVTRRSWYRHTEDWRLVCAAPGRALTTAG